MARYIVIDWGSTNLRAWLYQGDHYLESGRSEIGVTRLNGESPATVLAEIMTGWREEDTPVVMVKVVGSGVGWKVTPYLSVLVRFSSIDEQLTSVDNNAWVIPGLCVSHGDNHNVMRGEETQLIGAWTLAPSSFYVMLGTHCKWVQADSQQINDFRTMMTGELHHLLLSYPLIDAGLPPRENSADASAAGLKRDLNAPTILPQFFEIRASYVLGAFPHEQVSEFLSGLSIGAEITSMCDYVAHQYAITLAIGALLTTHYQRASRAIGCDVMAVTGDTASQTSIRSTAHAAAN